MSRVKGKVLIIPTPEVAGSFNRTRGKHASHKFDVEWTEYPKAECAKQIQKVVQTWANRKYLGRKVIVDQGTMRELGVDGVGTLFVDGIKYAEITAFIQLPEPVAAASLFGGGNDGR
ncbi:hypothetical protein [Glutamicibacter sp.]|uniref:hypothetical protein n=1 Tax=Glutamicibacter sp. TaxID=1931995 RepID=UPI0028BE3646|nr:hypothetical protein [Glutamicibacter sp.]